jgi:hypothetical protein
MFVCVRACACVYVCTCGFMIYDVTKEKIRIFLYVLLNNSIMLILSVMILCEKCFFLESLIEFVIIMRC